MGDIVLLSLIGVKVVLVHGGGPEITSMLNKIGKESKFVDGLRVTDKETAEIVQMILAGKINKDLVNLLQNKGGKAMGLCGMDGHLIEAKMMDEKLGYVGEITKMCIRDRNSRARSAMSNFSRFFEEKNIIFIPKTIWASCPTSQKTSSLRKSAYHLYA